MILPFKTAIDFAVGCDELIVPDFTMGGPQRRKDTCDQFIEEVASNFR